MSQVPNVAYTLIFTKIPGGAAGEGQGLQAIHSTSGEKLTLDGFYGLITKWEAFILACRVTTHRGEGHVVIAVGGVMPLTAL